MADDDTPPAETFGSDPEGIRQAVESQRHAKAVAEVSAATPEREPEEDEAPRVTDHGTEDLTTRRGCEAPAKLAG